MPKATTPARTRGLGQLSGNLPSAERSRARRHAAAQAALAENRPLTTAATPPSDRRHAADVPAAELVALMGVGILQNEAILGADNDPLVRSHAEYMALFEESLSAAEAAKLLRVDIMRVRQRLRVRSLFGLEYEGTWRLPPFQFERRRIIRGLASVLKALPSELFPLDVVDWFLLSEPELQLDSDAAPLSPREWLLAGRPIDAVARIARDLTSYLTRVNSANARTAAPLTNNKCLIAQDKCQ
jgi:hypothetical protein